MRVLASKVSNEVIAAEDELVILLNAIVRDVPLCVLKLRKVEMGATNAQVSLLVDEDAHGVERVNVDPLTDVKFA